MKTYLKMIPGLAAIAVASVLVGCQVKGEVKAEKKAVEPAKQEQVVKKSSVDLRVDALEKRVRSLEQSRADVKKYINRQVQEGKLSQ